MNSYVLLALLLCHNMLIAQIHDDFSDGNFNLNPTWIGDTAHFNAFSKTLRLDAPSKTDTSVLMLESSISTEARWEVTIGLDFNPSSSNYCRIYLMIDDTLISKKNQGYFVEIGGSKDDVSLYRKDQSSEEILIDGRDQVLSKNANELKVIVMRDSMWNWILHSDTSGNGHFIEEGRSTDSTHRFSRFFGVFCRYTSTRSDKFSFDNVKIDGKTYADKIKPRVLGHRISGTHSWSLSFSEILDISSIDLNKLYISSPRNKARYFDFDSSAFELTLQFENAFPHGRYLEFNIDSLCDTSGNCMELNNYILSYNNPDSIFFKDILINEIMVDPEPAIGLPGDEYIELFNYSKDVIKTDLLMLSDGKDSVPLSEHVLDPGGYMTVIPENGDTLAWKTLGINVEKGKLFSLNNSGKCIYLLTSQKIIDSLCYSAKEFSDTEGGRSLELINPGNQCHLTSNRSLSSDVSGGTPGRPNSILDSTWLQEPVQLEKVISLTDSQLTLNYSGHFKSLNLQQISSIPSIDFGGLEFGDGQLTLQLTLDEGNEGEHQLIIEDIEHCSGDTTAETDINFHLQNESAWKGLIINEVLFNPLPGGSDFIELRNNSENPVNLEGVMLTNGDDTTRLKEGYHLLKAGDYLAFTEDSINTAISYPFGTSININTSELPGFPDKLGKAILLDRDGRPLDSMAYADEMHFALLDNTEGISLERINPFVSAMNRSNWASSSSVIRGTPGRENSQYLNPSFGLFQLSPEIISPDNDGYQDVLSIVYQSEANHIGRVRIYDEYGRIIRELVSNELLSAKGVFHWDGLDNASQRVKSGYYLIFFESLGADGSIRKELATVVVAGK